jgi:hypothetical protein
MMIDIATAILAIKADAQVSVNAEDVNQINWVDGNPTNITTQQILDKQAELQAVHDALAYARAREVAYPQLKEFTEAYCEKEIGGSSTKWDAYVTKYNLVRSNNPKP